uniref:Uncharacterized protein n=1 Tax=Pyrodinium bahamense TaxID=73915 RepID=A0A7S0A754_9DINO|mmetsp:Transcript_25313/g.69612  ORF Transcript_25313/g.69612 Transcript_25313/m.69612 type:complete len:1066 (+) Transcript_25313:100-3297(+)
MAQASWQVGGYYSQAQANHPGYYAAPGTAPAAPAARQPSVGSAGYQGGAPPSGGRLPPQPQGANQGAAGQHGMPVVPPQKRPPPAGAEQGMMKQQRLGPGGYPGAGMAGGGPGGPVQVPPPNAGVPSAAPPQAAQPPTKETYVVSTSGRDGNEVVVRTLVGEYIEKGVNHGRKVYMKAHDKAVADYVDVLLYYWDSRDGPSFEGWWFGNTLGGTQVWSHCKDSGLLPPGAGWKIPWDGPVRPTLVVRNKEALLKEEAEAKLQALSDEVSKAEAEASQVMEQAKSACSSATVDGYTNAEQLLTPQVTALGEVVKKVQDSQRFAVGDIVKSFQHLSNTVKNLHDNLTGELNNMRTSRQKVEQDQKQKVVEERDTRILEELMPEALEKTNTAEDMVEKTVITSEMISSCGDDADMVKQAIEETERSAKAAQAAIGEARIYLNAKLASTRRFAERVRERASGELGKLQQQLQDAQNKLSPLKNVRQDYNQRKEAQKLVAEVEEKVVLAEVDVDRAEEMVSLLNADAPTKDGLTQAQTALQVAENHINKAMQLYETKKQSASGMPLEELSKLGPRGEAARTRITQLRSNLKEAGERVTTEGYLEEASDKVQAVTDALGKLEDSESRLQEGDEISLEETLATVKASEQLAAGAQTASSMARMFIQMKTLEVKRFSKGPSSEATQKLTDFQKQLEVATKRLIELKSGVNRRKRMALVREAESRVAKAEKLVETVKEAASIFADDAKLMELSPEEIREASEKTTVCEKEANEALMEVRKFVTARQIEAKGKDASVEISTELIKFQTRLSTAQSEVAKQRKLFTSVEQRLAVKRLLDEAEKKLNETEEKVAKAMEAVAGLDGLGMEPADDAKESDKMVKEAELAVQEAQISTRTTSRFLESQSRSQGFAKDAISKLEPRVKQCQDKVQSASTQIKERSEKIFARSIIHEAEAKVGECEAGLRKAQDAEAPFLQVEDGAVLDKASVMISEFERAIQAAQSVATSSKTFISMKRLTVKRLTDAASQTTNEALTKMQGTIDDVIKKLSEMRTRSAELKRAALRREVKGGKGASRMSG